MITPDKYTPLNDSILAKMISIIRNCHDEMPIIELYNKTKNDFSEIDEFILSLDTLYILDRVEVDFDKGVVSLC